MPKRPEQQRELDRVYITKRKLHGDSDLAISRQLGISRQMVTKEWNAILKESREHSRKGAEALISREYLRLVGLYSMAEAAFLRSQEDAVTVEVTTKDGVTTTTTTKKGQAGDAKLFRGALAAAKAIQELLGIRKHHVVIPSGKTVTNNIDIKAFLSNDELRGHLGDLTVRALAAASESGGVCEPGEPRPLEDGAASRPVESQADGGDGGEDQAADRSGATEAWKD